jgi:hypothetical protein
VVEHPLGKGEVVSSILPGSTTQNLMFRVICAGSEFTLDNERHNEARNSRLKSEDFDRTDCALSVFPRLLAMFARLLQVQNARGGRTPEPKFAES